MKKGELNVELKNDSGCIAYCGLQIMKGRIIVIDNETSPKMIVKDKYILAKSHNIELIP